MTKIVWVGLPLAGYAAYVVVRMLLRKPERSYGVMIHSSILLLFYLLITAGLGIFWVANQQLPVFDWHYLFGYATILLVAVHLRYTLPVAWRYLRKRKVKPASSKRVSGKSASGKSASGKSVSSGSVADRPALASAPPAKQAPKPTGLQRKSLLRAAGLAIALVLSFFLGMRQGSNVVTLASDNGQAALNGTSAIVERYHELSSASRTGVFARAPGIAWGGRPEPFKRYPTTFSAIDLLPPTELSSRGLSAAIAQPAAKPLALDVQAIGSWLHHGSGITLRRGGRGLRAAPSSGALFPNEIYLLVRSAAGIPAGVYHFDSEYHRLITLSQRELTAAELGLPSLPPGEAMLVMTSIFRRTGFKYRDRAYRYAVADAGHLLENLRIGAHELGRTLTPLAAFDEAAVAAVLGVDGVEEGVLALATLSQPPATLSQPPATSLQPPTKSSGPPTTSSGPPTTSSGPPTIDSAGSAQAPHANIWHDRSGRDVSRAFYRPATAPEQLTLGVTSAIHYASSLTLIQADRPTEAADRVALPKAPSAATEPALRVIARRRSVRRYGDAAVPIEQLAAVLRDATQPPLLSFAIDIQLVANRVAGLAPGAYRYAPAEHALLLLRPGELEAATRSAGLSQDVIGDAAVVFMLSMNRRVGLAEGARGYRHALLETGMVGERLMLSAIARGMGFCPAGAFYDDETPTLLGLDPAAHWVLHFGAMGLP